MAIPSGEPDNAALFNEYHARIVRYLAAIVRDRADAEDLAQETFLRAFQARESLRDPGAMRGWLYRIATRVAVDRLRQRIPVAPLESEDEAQPAAAPSALELLERGQTTACVHRCLAYLPDHYRAVILLSDAHGLSAAQIAAWSGESVGTVKIRLHRARRRLQQIMECGCALSESGSGVPCCEPKPGAAGPQ